MRMIMLVEMPIEPFNTFIKNGTAGAKMKQILDAVKPEDAWFFERDGRRTGLLVVNLEEASGIPALAEPWFLTLNARVEIRPAMTVEDLVHANLDALGKQWA